MTTTPQSTGRAVPTPLPQDTVHVAADDLRITLAPADPGKVDLGLLVTLPPPFGPVRITLVQRQVLNLYEALESLLTLPDAAVAELVAKLHASPTTEGNPNA